MQCRKRALLIEQGGDANVVGVPALRVLGSLPTYNRRCRHELGARALHTLPDSTDQAATTESGA